MTRKEKYGERADAEFENAMAWYAQHHERCKENCGRCGEIDCKEAWMATELDENGDPICN